MQHIRIALPALILVGLKFIAGSEFSNSHYVNNATQSTVDDLVILNGRLMDPASGLDAIRAVGISNGKVRAVSTQPLRGRDTIDARELVVAPGFIDLHQHAQSPQGYRVAVLDGTTTALDLEGGTDSVGVWYRERENKTLINYGVSVGHEWLRMRAMGDTSHGEASGRARSSAATGAELANIIASAKHGLDEGALAVGLIIEFTPGATPWEIFEMFRVAAAYRATVHVHLRGVPEPYYFIEIEEIIGASAATGASAHSDAKFKRFEWPATGERLTRESFGRYHQIGGMLVEHNNTEETVLAAVRDPLPMIASDGILHDSIAHPRVAGTFARVIGHYARDVKTLSLMEGLRKITIEPARRLEKRVPSMVHKGRIQIGADADIVVFDTARVIDKATYRQPTLPPDGIPYVLVNGIAVVQNGAIRSGVFPGRAVRAPVQ